MRSVASILIVALAGLAGACAAGGRGQGDDSLLTSLQVYTGGDAVTFVLQVMNTAATPLELTFSDGQTFDFAVQQGERVVWRWSDDQTFTQALRRERIAPGESRTFQAEWRPAAGLQGELVGVGRLTASDHHVEQATRFILP